MARHCIAVLLLLAGGCAAPPTLPPVGEHPESLVLCEDLRHSVSWWYVECAPKLHDPLIVCVHGGTLKGQWYCYPDHGYPMSVESMAQTLHLAFPRRDILLVCCNPDGLDIRIPGVWYARDAVWVTPDRYCVFTGRRKGGVGRIEDFVTTRPHDQ